MRKGWSSHSTKHAIASASLMLASVLVLGAHFSAAAEQAQDQNVIVVAPVLTSSKYPILLPNATDKAAINTQPAGAPTAQIKSLLHKI